MKYPQQGISKAFSIL